MKKGSFFLLITLLFSFTPYKLVKTKVNDEITILLPKNFKAMDELDFSQRYPSVRKPIAGYTNEAREVDFSINISATQWPDANAEIAKKFFKSGVMNMFDGVEMIEEGTRTLNGKEFVYFEFESRIKGERSKMELRDAVLGYTYIQYLVEPGRTLVFSFNCPKRIRDEWQETARKMMKGVKVK